MKRITAIITLVFALAAFLCGCTNTNVTPTVSPNVPIVSESPAIPSPDLSASPALTPSASPSASPTT